jgi:hypothetical protein
MEALPGLRREHASCAPPPADLGRAAGPPARQADPRPCGATAPGSLSGASRTGGARLRPSLPQNGGRRRGECLSQAECVSASASRQQQTASAEVHSQSKARGSSRGSEV